MAGQQPGPPARLRKTFSSLLVVKNGINVFLPTKVRNFNDICNLFRRFFNGAGDER
jgi:hypothetical protein